MNFEDIEKVLIPSQIMIKTIKFLQQMGEEEKEAHSLWVGDLFNNIFNIKDVLFPEQVSCSFFFHVSAKELDKINRDLYKRNLRLIAQIHSHREDAFHSSIDDEHPIVTTLGGFSIVIPNYGFVHRYNIHEYAIFRLTINGWIELTIEEIDNIFSIIEEDEINV